MSKTMLDMLPEIIKEAMGLREKLESLNQERKDAMEEWAIKERKNGSTWKAEHDETKKRIEALEKLAQSYALTPEQTIMEGMEK